MARLNGPTWNSFSSKEVKQTHGNIDFYRKLYSGDHASIFPRARKKVEEGELMDEILYNEGHIYKYPGYYMVANISRLIADIPAMLVSRATGEATTSIPQEKPEDEEESSTEVNPFPASVTTSFEDEALNDTPHERQAAIFKSLNKNSKMHQQHKKNINALQVDGGLVGVIQKNARGYYISFKQRDVYYPHPDGEGVDLVMDNVRFDNDEEGIEYTHVYRERVEEEGGQSVLYTENILYKGVGQSSGSTQKEEIPEQEAKQIMGLKEMVSRFPGRQSSFVEYLPNNPTFMDELGVSALVNQGPKQEEINQTLTRASRIFEQNGKPRVAINPQLYEAMKADMQRRTGMKNPPIDSEDLDILTFDKDGRAMEIYQIDPSKLGNMPHVKDIMKLMFMETQTSERAADFYMGESNSSGAQSGTAKWYDLWVSIMKAEELLDQYLQFLTNLYENALWLMNNEDNSIIIEEPNIKTLDMLPISKRERVEMAKLAVGDQKAIATLRTALREVYPNASEEWIDEEVEQIQEEAASSTANSLGMAGGGTMANYNDNRDEQGNPIDNPAAGEGDNGTEGDE